MKDQSKTIQVLIQELAYLRQRISELERSEEISKESEERFTIAFHANPAPMTISTVDDGVVLDANDRWLSMMGYTQDEMIGQESGKLPIWVDHDARASFIKKFFKEGFLRGEAVQLRTKSGEIREILWSAELVRYRGKEVVLSLLYDITERKQAEEALQQARDELEKRVADRTEELTRVNEELRKEITERKHTEEALRESEKRERFERNRLELILKTAQDGFWLVDASTGHLIDVNEASCSMLGYTREELMTHGLADIDAQWSPKEIGREMQKIKTTGNALFETRHRVKGGQIIDVEISVNYLPATDQFFSFIRDISEHKRAEKALQENEKKFRTLFDRASDGILIVDPITKNFLQGNAAICSMLGYTKEEIKSLTIYDIHPPKDDSLVSDEFEKQIKREKALAENMPLLRKDGLIIYADIGTADVIIEGTDYLMGTFRDITERKQAEDKIRQMAYYDFLTGLPNRKLFSDRLGIALAQAQRNKKGVAISMLDLDNFKNANDTLGHDVGDLLLKAVAERLSAALRKADTVARFGGDEFVLIIPDLKGIEDAIPVAQKIVDSFHKPFFIDIHQLIVTTSIGIAVFPHDGTDETILLKNADIAMYQAKQAGRDRYRLYKKA